MTHVPLRRRTLSGAVCLAFLFGCGGEEAPTAPQAAAPAPATPAIREAAPEPAEPPPPRDPQTVFWERLSTLCGLAYAGFLTVGTEESDRYFGEADLKLHVRDCNDDEIRIPFHVSEDRSRTFVLRKTDEGLTLHHRHLDEAGQPAPPDNYGGRTLEEGTASRQEFVVDDATVTMLPEARYNVWAIEIEPGNYFAYELKRVEEERYFRVEFTLDETIDSPPPAWGAETG